MDWDRTPAEMPPPPCTQPVPMGHPCHSPGQLWSPAGVEAKSFPWGPNGHELSVLSSMGCVIPGKLLELSVPLFLHL